MAGKPSIRDVDGVLDSLTALARAEGMSRAVIVTAGRLRTLNRRLGALPRCLNRFEATIQGAKNEPSSA